MKKLLYRPAHYLGLINSKGTDAYQQVSKSVRGLKDLAKNTDVPLVFLSQISKKYWGYTELNLGSARDSGAIGEASDYVLTLTNREDEPKNDLVMLRNLTILKNRNGGKSSVILEMDKISMQINEYE